MVHSIAAAAAGATGVGSAAPTTKAADQRDARPIRAGSSSSVRTSTQTANKKKTVPSSSPGSASTALSLAPGEVKKKSKKQSSPLPRVATLAKPPPPKSKPEERLKKKSSLKPQSAGGVRSARQITEPQRANDRTYGVQSPLSRSASLRSQVNSPKSSATPPSRPSSGVIRTTERPPGSAGLSESLSVTRQSSLSRTGSPVPTPVQESSSTRVQKVLNEAEEEVSAIKRALGLDNNSIADVTTDEVQVGKSREELADAKLADAFVGADNPEKVSPVEVSVEKTQDVALSKGGKEEKQDTTAQGCCCCVM